MLFRSDKKGDDMCSHMVETYSDTVLEKQFQAGREGLPAAVTGQIDRKYRDKEKVDKNNHAQR